MKNTAKTEYKQTLTDEEIEKIVEEQRRLTKIEEAKKPAPPRKPRKCQWCGGMCGNSFLSYIELGVDGQTFYKGWFSPACIELAEEACRCIERDNS